MAAPETPCEPWTSADEIARCCGGRCPSEDQDLVDDAIAWSSAILYRLDRRRLRGTCTLTVTACFRETSCSGCGRLFNGWDVDGPIGPIGWSGWYQVYRTVHPSATASCGCSTRCDENLLLAPVGLISGLTEVVVNGVSEPLAGFVIVDRVYVKRLAGPWPTGAEVRLGIRFGRAIPRDARSAASELACHWLRAHCGSSAECGLPEDITSITREEVSLTLTSEADIDRISAGLTGLPWVDRWIRSRRTSGTARVLSSASPPRFRETRSAS